MSDSNGAYTEQELRDRLSISTLVFHQYRPISKEALSELTKFGITQIELIESPEQYDLADMRSMEFVQEACRDAGVQVAAYHAYQTNFADVDSEEKRQERTNRCRRQIDTMLELGGVLWGSHAGEVDEFIAKSYEELALHVEGRGAVITVENFTKPCVAVEDQVVFLDAMDHPQVGMILDIGHVRNPMGRIR